MLKLSLSEKLLSMSGHFLTFSDEDLPDPKFSIIRAEIGLRAVDAARNRSLVSILVKVELQDIVYELRCGALRLIEQPQYLTGARSRSSFLTNLPAS